MNYGLWLLMRDNIESFMKIMKTARGIQYPIANKKYPISKEE